jgi:hypothetical protein
VAQGCWRKRGDVGCAAPTDRLFRTPLPVGPRRPALRSVRGLLVGPRRLAPRPSTRRGASVLRHHNHWVRRHHNHHHCRVRRRHQHMRAISPRGTSSSNNNSNSNSSKSSGCPTSKVAGRSRAPSDCIPLLFFSLVYLLCRQVLTHPLLVKASSPSAPKVVPPPTPAAAAETAPPGSHAPARGPTAAAPQRRRGSQLLRRLP